MNRSAWIAILIMLSLAGPARARGKRSVPVQICATAKGLSPGDLLLARSRLFKELEGLGARVTPMANPTQEGGCATPAHLQQAREAGAKGVLDVRILRFGPVVHISVRAFRVKTGREVLHVKARASAQKYPASTSLKGILSKALARISHRPKPKHPRVADKKPGDRKPEDDRVDDTGIPPDQRIAVGTAAEDIPAVPAEVVFLDEEVGPGPLAGRKWTWIGGSLTAGGALLAAAGVYVLLVPMRDALNARDQARARAESPETPPELRAVYYDEFYRQQDVAYQDYVLGWVGIGVGAGIAIAGVVLLVLNARDTPDEGPPEEYGTWTPALRPLFVEGGGGALLEFRF